MEIVGLVADLFAGTTGAADVGLQPDFSSRMLTVGADNRAMTVGAEARNMTVGGDDRAMTVGAEARNMTVQKE